MNWGAALTASLKSRSYLCVLDESTKSLKTGSRADVYTEPEVI